KRLGPHQRPGPTALVWCWPSPGRFSAGSEWWFLRDRDETRRGFHLLDVAALVVGYSLASLLVRAFWPTGTTPPVVVLFVLTLAFLWLGMAMSGPIVLLGHRRGAVDPDSGLLPPRTWAELAWLIVGFYWIGLTILVVPARGHSDAVLDSAFLGLFP